MADISRYLEAISNAIYGEEVRDSIHDAIDIINKVGEVQLTLGTDVTSPSSSTQGFYVDSVYVNLDTCDLWKCTGDAWELEGNLKGLSLTVDTYKVGGETTVIIHDIDGDHTIKILDGPSGPGTGDMLRSMYDQNGNNIVDAVDSITYATADFSEASSRSNINTGETSAVLFGKIKKYFADLSNVAFSGSYSDLSNKATFAYDSVTETITFSG